MLDALRPPPPLDPARRRYKDWLHLNVFDPASGCVGLFNASLHGAPEDERSRVIGTALVHHPQLGWLGNVEVGGYASATIGIRGIALEQVAVALDGSTGAVHASATLAGDRVEARLTATARRGAGAIDIELPLPFGSGWIAWRVIPRLVLDGSLSLGGTEIALAGATAYHDHNWGRWRWGDDAGWEWGAFASSSSAEVLVVSRTTNRAHDVRGPALLTVDAGERRRAFSGAQVQMSTTGTFVHAMRRVPGALAALHSDRSHSNLPAVVEIEASDGANAVSLRFVPRAVAQLIAAEPTHAGYSFLHEMVGTWEATGSWLGESRRTGGLGVFEWVS